MPHVHTMFIVPGVIVTLLVRSSPGGGGDNKMVL